MRYFFLFGLLVLTFFYTSCTDKKSCCEANCYSDSLWKYVYNYDNTPGTNKRITTISECVTIRGKALNIENPDPSSLAGDGDIHITVKLDSTEAAILNSVNHASLTNLDPDTKKYILANPLKEGSTIFCEVIFHQHPFPGVNHYDLIYPLFLNYKIFERNTNFYVKIPTDILTKPYIDITGRWVIDFGDVNQISYEVHPIVNIN